MNEILKDYPGYTLHEAESPFVRHIGRLYQKTVQVAPGRTEFWMAMPIEAHQTNKWGYAHATLISSIAEISAGAPAYVPDEDPFLIIQLNVEFIGAAKLGDFVEGCGVVTQKTRSLCFTRSHGVVGDRTIFTATAIQKRVKI
jgi:acyl-coenzyme A thioesterase PaaI-like protein